MRAVDESADSLRCALIEAQRTVGQCAGLGRYERDEQAALQEAQNGIVQGVFNTYEFRDDPWPHD